MIKDRSPYLAGVNAWLLGAAVALVLGVGLAALGPVRDLFETTRSEATDLEAEIRAFKERRASFRPVTDQERATMERVWSDLSEETARVHDGSTADLVRELSRLVEEAGAQPSAVHLSRTGGARRADGVTGLNLVSMDGEPALELDPRGVQLQIEGDLAALARALERLSEPGRPLQLERINVKPRGNQVHATVDLVYFVRGGSA